MGGRGASSGRLISGDYDKLNVDEILDELKGINPNYHLHNATELGYHDNCVKACYTLDAIARGIDCEAKPTKSTRDFTIANWDNMMVGQRSYVIKSNSVNGAVSELRSKMAYYGNGSRAIVVVDLKTHAHAVVAMQRGNQTIFVDPQRGTSCDMKRLLHKGNFRNVEISRIDNLLPGKQVERCYKKKASKPKKKVK